MSRPQLKLPKKASNTALSSAPRLAEPEHPALLSSAVTSFIAQIEKGTSTVEPSIDDHSTTSAVKSPLGPSTVDEETSEARLLLIAQKIRGRFRPVSMKYFITYAKNLSRLTDERMVAARETLARIYGYENLWELTQELKEPSEAGPFDDILSDEEWDEDIVQLALLARWERAFEIIHARIPRLRDDTNSPYSAENLQNMSLFSTPKFHFYALTTLNLPPFVSESASRRMASRAAASDDLS